LAADAVDSTFTKTIIKIVMFEIFKRKTQKEELGKLCQKLSDEAYKLSFVNIERSKQKMAEVEDVMKQMGVLDSQYV